MYLTSLILFSNLMNQYADHEHCLGIMKSFDRVRLTDILNVLISKAMDPQTRIINKEMNKENSYTDRHKTGRQSRSHAFNFAIDEIIKEVKQHGLDTEWEIQNLKYAALRTTWCLYRKTKTTYSNCSTSSKTPQKSST